MKGRECTITRAARAKIAWQNMRDAGGGVFFEDWRLSGESTGRINSKMKLVKVKVLNEVRYQCSLLAKCAAGTAVFEIKGLIKRFLCRGPLLLATSPAKSVLRSPSSVVQARPSLFYRLVHVCNFRPGSQKLPRILIEFRFYVT